MNKQIKPEKFLILLCGLPGTGKTTTAKTLAQNLSQYALIEQNEVRRKHGIKRMPKTQDAVLREIDRLTAGFLNEGQGVIVESGNRYSWRRHQMYGIASGAGKRVATLEVICPEQLAKKRIRSRPPGDGLIDDPTDPKVYDRIKALWEDVLVDFKDPGEDHVSYVKFNTESQKLERVIVRRGMKTFITKLERVLHKHA